MNTANSPGLSQARGTRALVALGLGSFVIGTAELLVVGVLNLVAKDLRVSVSTAGQLVTAYALGISVGGPIVSALTTRFGRRFLLVAALVAYVIGNVVAVAAVGFGVLIVARVLTGSIHGLFIGVASVVAASLVPPERQGRAMGMVFGGIAVATVLGVPLGTLIGQGLGWRAAFVGVVILGVLALVATLLLVPSVPRGESSGLGTQARAAFAPRVLGMLGVGLLLIGGQFTVFTYLAPFLQDITGIPGGLISVFLLAYGLASAIGTFIGGRFADHGAARTLIAANLVLIAVFVVLYLVGATPGLVGLILAVWGLVGFGLVPSLQLRVITLSGPGADLAATLGASAVNAGIAGGALLGGWVLAQYGVHAVVLAGLIICAVAFPATWAAALLKPPAPEPDASGANATEWTGSPVAGT